MAESYPGDYEPGTDYVQKDDEWGLDQIVAYASKYVTIERLGATCLQLRIQRSNGDWYIVDLDSAGNIYARVEEK